VRKEDKAVFLGSTFAGIPGGVRRPRTPRRDVPTWRVAVAAIWGRVGRRAREQFFDNLWARNERAFNAKAQRSQDAKTGTMAELNAKFRKEWCYNALKAAALIFRAPFLQRFATQNDRAEFRRGGGALISGQGVNLTGGIYMGGPAAHRRFALPRLSEYSLPLPIRSSQDSPPEFKKFQLVSG
jgi:hypothetical protein